MLSLEKEKNNFRISKFLFFYFFGAKLTGKVEREREKLTGDTGGAVDEDEDHAAKSPGYAENSNAATCVGGFGGIGLALVADNGKYGNVKEKKGSNELCYDSSVE